jgi:hypothetical protein
MGFFDIENAIRNLFFALDTMLYVFIEKVFNFIIELGYFSLFDYDSDIYPIVRKIYILLGIIILFRVALSLLTLVTAPESLSVTDKKHDNYHGRLIPNTIAAVVLVIALPMVFDFSVRLQDAILDVQRNPDGSLMYDNNGNLIVGTEGFLQKLIVPLGYEVDPDDVHYSMGAGISCEYSLRKFNTQYSSEYYKPEVYTRYILTGDKYHDLVEADRYTISTSGDITFDKDVYEELTRDFDTARASGTLESVFPEFNNPMYSIDSSGKNVAQKVYWVDQNRNRIGDPMPWPNWIRYNAYGMGLAFEGGLNDMSTKATSTVGDDAVLFLDDEPGIGELLNPIDSAILDAIVNVAGGEPPRENNCYTHLVGYINPKVYYDEDGNVYYKDNNIGFLGSFTFMTFGFYSYADMNAWYKKNYNIEENDAAKEPDLYYYSLTKIDPNIEVYTLSGGRMLVSYIMQTFMNSNDGTVKSYITTANYNTIKQEKIIEDKENLEYVYGVSTLATLAILCVLLVITFDVALRIVKLGFLQIISPIPVILHITTEKFENSMLKRWTDEYVKTYVDLFFRLSLVYFAILVLNMLKKTFEGRPFSLITIFILVGALMFVKQAPSLLKSLLNIKGDFGGGFTLNPIAKLRGVPLVGAAASAATGAAGGMFTGLAHSRGNLWNRMKATLGGGIKGGLAGARSVGFGGVDSAADYRKAGGLGMFNTGSTTALRAATGNPNIRAGLGAYIERAASRGLHAGHAGTSTGSRIRGTKSSIRQGRAAAQVQDTRLRTARALTGIAQTDMADATAARTTAQTAATTAAGRTAAAQTNFANAQAARSTTQANLANAQAAVAAAQNNVNTNSPGLRMAHQDYLDANAEYTRRQQETIQAQTDLAEARRREQELRESGASAEEIQAARDRIQDARENYRDAMTNEDRARARVDSARADLQRKNDEMIVYEQQLLEAQQAQAAYEEDLNDAQADEAAAYAELQTRQAEELPYQEDLNDAQADEAAAHAELQRRQAEETARREEYERTTNQIASDLEELEKLRERKREQKYKETDGQ